MRQVIKHRDIRLLNMIRRTDTERVKTLFLTEKHQRIKPLFDIRAILNKKQN